MQIIFYEDWAQLEKILFHIPCKKYIAIKYIRRKICSIHYIVDGKFADCNIICLILKTFWADKIICEYSNGLPRLWATIFGKKIESHLFGFLDRSDFNFSSAYKLKLVRKLLNRLYANEYIIYGSNNPTRDLICDIQKHYNSNVKVAAREDLTLYPKANPEYIWSVYVAQPWHESGNDTIEKIQKELYQTMRSKLSNVFYCKHPRQAVGNNESNMLIDGWLELKERMRINGPPAIATSISSSLIYELQEMGVNAVHASERVNGQTVLPDMSVAMERIYSEISHLD